MRAPAAKEGKQEPTVHGLGPKSLRKAGALDLPKRRQGQAARSQDARTEGALTGRAGTGTTHKGGT